MNTYNARGHIYAPRRELKQQLQAALIDIEDSYFDGTSDEDRFRKGRKFIKDPEYAKFVKELISYLFDKYAKFFTDDQLDYPILYLVTEVKRDIQRLRKEQKSLMQISMFPEDEERRRKRSCLIDDDIKRLERIKRLLIRTTDFIEPMYKDPI